MANKDWKDILNATFEKKHEFNPEAEPTIKANAARQDLTIRFEKRNGKPATIISNFNGSKSELKELAGELKKYCGTGGSAKDDEILIQGDVRNDVANFLRNRGHIVRGDFKK